MASIIFLKNKFFIKSIKWLLFVWEYLKKQQQSLWFFLRDSIQLKY